MRLVIHNGNILQSSETRVNLCEKVLDLQLKAALVIPQKDDIMPLIKPRHIAVLLNLLDTVKHLTVVLRWDNQCNNSNSNQLSFLLRALRGIASFLLNKLNSSSPNTIRHRNRNTSMHQDLASSPSLRMSDSSRSDN